MPKESTPGPAGKVLTSPRDSTPVKRREIGEKHPSQLLGTPTVTEIGPDPPEGASSMDPQLLRQIAGIAVILLLVGGFVWWNKGRTQTAPGAGDSGTEASGRSALTSQLGGSADAGSTGINVVGTADELSKPWAAKKFTFVKPYTQEKVSAMAIRLPSGELWGFALQTPYSSCALEFVTDMGRLTSQFHYEASHPMIVAPCDGTIYDPLKVGPLGADTWARGEIVKGAGLRPPVAINVEANGNSIIADRME